MIFDLERLEDKWCPYIRITVLEDGRFLSNRGEIAHPEESKTLCQCIGPKCILWEWDVVNKSGYCSGCKDDEMISRDYS